MFVQLGIVPLPDHHFSRGCLRSCVSCDSAATDCQIDTGFHIPALIEKLNLQGTLMFDGQGAMVSSRFESSEVIGLNG